MPFMEALMAKAARSELYSSMLVFTIWSLFGNSQLWLSGNGDVVSTMLLVDVLYIQLFQALMHDMSSNRTLCPLDFAVDLTVPVLFNFRKLINHAQTADGVAFAAKAVTCTLY